MLAGHHVSHTGDAPDAKRPHWPGRSGRGDGSVSLSHAHDGNPGYVAVLEPKGSAVALENRVVGLERKDGMLPGGSPEEPAPRTGCAGRVRFMIVAVSGV